MFTGKTILVTGGTGSFGRAFIKHVITHYDPKKVIIFSRDELKQFEMQAEFSDSRLRFFIGDVRDKYRLRQAMQGVEYVVHAAAMKQIPIAEYNPIECIKTNIHGAENIIEAALSNEVEKVIALSTDKAVSPVNLYGATKLASDKLFIAANNIVGNRKTRFSITRYGNVVGSRGSVIPLFKKMVQDGKTELPITDPRMTRFLITLEQGVKFVLQNFSRMRGGEIFIPKIPTAHINDIVEAVAPKGGIKTKHIGIRPGEKLHEIMCTKDDAHLTLEFNDHYVIKPSITLAFNADYVTNGLNEIGKPVVADFYYDSETNPHYLTVSELINLFQD
jgi:UDP-N-acetylglucosamine 4,6-dehydratase